MNSLELGRSIALTGFSVVSRHLPGKEDAQKFWMAAKTLNNSALMKMIFTHLVTDWGQESRGLDIYLHPGTFL
jgi:hypothetical protein